MNLKRPQRNNRNLTPTQKGLLQITTIGRYILRGVRSDEYSMTFEVYDQKIGALVPQSHYEITLIAGPLINGTYPVTDIYKDTDSDYTFTVEGATAGDMRDGNLVVPSNSDFLVVTDGDEPPATIGRIAAGTYETPTGVSLYVLEYGDYYVEKLEMKVIDTRTGALVPGIDFVTAVDPLVMINIDFPMTGNERNPANISFFWLTATGSNVSGAAAVSVPEFSPMWRHKNGGYLAPGIYTRD